MKRQLLCLLLALPLLSASPAMALFNVQVLTGKRDTEFKSSTGADKASGDELKLAAHLDPIPLVPIGFGLSVAQITWDKVGDDIASVEATELGLEVEAWLPLELMGFVPYAKIGYTVLGGYNLSFKTDLGSYKGVYQPSGLYLAAGLKWEFLMRLGVMVEIEQATRTLGFDALEEVAQNPVTSKLDQDANSTSLLFGLQAGL